MPISTGSGKPCMIRARQRVTARIRNSTPLIKMTTSAVAYGTPMRMTMVWAKTAFIPIPGARATGRSASSAMISVPSMLTNAVTTIRE